MFRASILAMLLAFSGNLAAADDRPVRGAGRGELLYSTHCVACHAAQVHWRDKKLVTNWGSLQAEVSRWQGIAALGWSDDDVAVVARYLNALHYRYPVPDGPGDGSARPSDPIADAARIRCPLEDLPVIDGAIVLGNGADS